MARRDRVNLTAQLPQESFLGWYVEPAGHFDSTSKRFSGYLRFFGPAKKFVKSVPFEVQLTDPQMDQFMTLLVNRIVAQTPALAGTRVVEDVNNPDEDPA